MLKNINKKLIVTLAFTAVIAGSLFVTYKVKTAEANSCERTYGGGMDCDKRIDVRKEVRLNDDDKFKETISGVKKNQIFTFRITVINNGETDIKDIDVIDELPDTLEIVEAGELGKNLKDNIEVMDNGDEYKLFNSGCAVREGNGVKVYCFRAKVKNSAFDGAQKCAINTVKIKGKLDSDDDRKTLDSDVAIVCFGDLKELPKTGAESTLAYTIVGLGMFLTGLVIKRFV